MSPALAWVVALGCFVVASIIPPLVVLAFVTIPLVILSDMVVVLPPLWVVHGARIRIYDVVAIAVTARVCIQMARGTAQWSPHPLFGRVLLFVATLLLATGIAYLRFGAAVFGGEIISLLRLCWQISPLFLLPAAVRGTPGSLERCIRGLDRVGLLTAGLAYASMILYWAGIRFGEVQESATGVRFFGPLGDSLGFLLLFFLYRKLLDGRWISAAWFLGAIVATGTRGAFLALLVGLGYMSFCIPSRPGTARPRFVAFLLFAAVLLLQDVGGMRSRMSGRELESTADQRMLTMKFGWAVFVDNPMVGVGYTGFRYCVDDYDIRGAFLARFGSYASNFGANTSNQYLQTATDGGIPALIAFLLMAAAMLRTLREAAEREGAFFQAGRVWLVSILFGMQFAAWMLPGALMACFLWLVLGLAVAGGPGGIR